MRLLLVEDSLSLCEVLSTVLQKEKYEEIKAAADNAGEPVNGYIKKAIDERMERDSQAPSSTAMYSPDF